MSFRKEGYSDIDKWRKTVRNYNKRYYKQTAKKVSDEQREAAGERFRKMWEEKKGVNYDE